MMSKFEKINVQITLDLNIEEAHILINLVEQLLELLGEGDFFGEVALLLKQPRNATIRSIGYCDLYSLNKESFDRVISYYTDFEKKIQQMARDRMHSTNKPEGLTLL